MKSEIKLEVEGGALSDLVICGLKLEEGLSKPYRAEITALSETVRSPAKLRDDTLGHRVTLKIVQAIEDEGTVTRYLNGVITAAAHLGTKIANEEIVSFCGTAKRRLSSFRIVIEPQLAALAYARRTLDYPDTTPLGVIKAVLGRNKIDFAAEGQFLAQEEYSGKVRFVQRDETDLAFIERIMSRYGISYTFTHSSKGNERVVLSDGADYPALSPLEFNGLDDYSDGNELAFSTEKTKGMYRITDFTAESKLGFVGLKDGFIRPAQTKQIEHEEGDTGSTRIWLRNERPAAYGEDVDDSTVDKDLERYAKATKAALKLADDDWHGETPHIAAMSGKVLKIASFVDGADADDEPVKARVTSTSLNADLLAKDDDVFRLSFKAMDFADDLQEKRWVPTPASDKAVASSLIEAVVCDRNGKFDDSQTINTIVTSPHATPEMPWVFLVRNPNPGSEDGVNVLIDVAMTQPLGGKRAGLYRFPRVGERVFVMLAGDRAVLMGYVPDRTNSFSDFPENGDKWARQSTALRFTPPTEDKKADGNYSEIGLSYHQSAVEAMEQRIIEGTAFSFLVSIAVAANNNRWFNSVYNNAKAKIDKAHDDYFDQPGKESCDAVSSLANELVSTYDLEDYGPAAGTVLRLRSSGSIVQYAPDGIDISTEGSLRISARDITIYGRNDVDVQGDASVHVSSGASTTSVNPDGVVLRSRRVIDAPGAYDSSVTVTAIDGVTVAGANVTARGLFSTQMVDALGAGVTTTDGELMVSGAAIDLSTITRADATEAFANYDEVSGLKAMSETLEAWQGGKTPDGNIRSLTDRDAGAYGLGARVDTDASPQANFRGTLTGVSVAGHNLCATEQLAGKDARGDQSAYTDCYGGGTNLSISQRELVRAQTYARQVDAHRQTAESVLQSVVEGKSSSVTIHGHQLDLNVQILKDLSEQKNSDGASGSGAA